MNKTAILICLAALLIITAPAQAELGTVEFIYKCGSCKEQFKAYVVQQLEGYHIEIDAAQLSGKKKQALEDLEAKGTVSRISQVNVAEYDSDTCYMFSSINKYALAVITCPYCGYSAMHKDFGKLRPNPAVQRLVTEKLSPQIEQFKKDLAKHKYGFKPEDIRELNQPKRVVQNGKTVEYQRKLYGSKIKEYDMQNKIPAHLKYENIIGIYRAYGFAPSVLAKLALNGAWAYRVEVCMPFTISDEKFTDAIRRIVDLLGKEYFAPAPDLSGTEMNHRRKAALEKLLNDRKLNDMQKYVVYNMLIDISDRLGFPAQTRQYFSKAQAHAGDHSRLKLYLQKKKEWLDYEQQFLKIAVMEKTKGFRAFNYSRPELLKEMYLMADLLRRTGRDDEGRAWLVCLIGLKDCPAELKEAAVVQLKNPGGILPPAGTMPAAGDATQLLEQIRGGFGTVAYYGQHGYAKKGLHPQTCQKVMQTIGYAIMVYKDKNGFFPDNFEELWQTMTIRDRSQVNLFCCPVTGIPLRYAPAKTGFMVWPLLCDDREHVFNFKDRQQYGVFHTNGRFKIKDSIPAEMLVK